MKTGKLENWENWENWGQCRITLFCREPFSGVLRGVRRTKWLSAFRQWCNSALSLVSLPGEYSFHFDRFNRNSGLAGAIGHGLYDWIGGTLFGHPCLDPAWHQ